MFYHLLKISFIKDKKNNNCEYFLIVFYLTRAYFLLLKFNKKSCFYNNIFQINKEGTL